MGKEIERKFLVNDDVFKAEAIKKVRITQAYLSSKPDRSVRVRMVGDKGYITIKGLASKSGVSRFEWEKEIPPEEAAELLKICEPGKIDKHRFLVTAGQHTFEVDEFFGDNEGLTIAEIELGTENETYIRPNWLGEEVTGDIKYYNSSLVKKPYKNW